MQSIASIIRGANARPGQIKSRLAFAHIEGQDEVRHVVAGLINVDRPVHYIASRKSSRSINQAIREAR